MVWTASQKDDRPRTEFGELDIDPIADNSAAVRSNASNVENGRNRVVIENVCPQIDGGRHPVRRTVGDQVRVTASIFADGHDQLAGRVRYRHESEGNWRFVSMKRDESLSGDPDEWVGVFTLDKVGLWSTTVLGWVDHFATWASDFKKSLIPPVGQQSMDADMVREIPVKLRSGARLLESIAQRAIGPDAGMLIDRARLLDQLADERFALHEFPLEENIERTASRYPDLSLASRFEPDLQIEVERGLAGFSSWYEIFPRSTSGIPGQHGTFADVERQLPEIAAMGFDIVYLPPVHPIGRTNRRGRNNSIAEGADEPGSPWAIGDREAGNNASGGVHAGTDCGGHKSIHPQLGDFESFGNLVATAGSHGMEIALDIAFQCSPDHPWVIDHPQWFYVRPDGSIQHAENPPKLYKDIYPLNFESEDWRALWEELYSVFEFWIERGVRVFRVDNPHTKAISFWEWCLNKLHRRYPDVILLAEAFTRPRVMYELAKIGFTQSYTYFTWRNTKKELQSYLEEITRPPISEFFRPNFWPSTPDILPAFLQEGGPSAFRQRLILAATLSANYGIYGPAYELCENIPTKPAPGKNESEEFLDSEKYQILQRDRNATGSLVLLIRQLNQIRRGNRALQSNHSLHFHNVDNEKLICYSKATVDFSNILLVIVNLDPFNSQVGWIDLDLEHIGLVHDTMFDVEELLVGGRDTWHGCRKSIELRADGEVAAIFHVYPNRISPMDEGAFAPSIEVRPPVFWREEE